MTMSGYIRFNHVGPQFRVKDVSKSREYYRNVLGFKTDYLYGSPPTYAVVFRDDVYIHLSLNGPAGMRSGLGCAFVAIDGVDQLWSKLRAESVDIVETLREHGDPEYIRIKEFSIRDLDGNVLRIGEIIGKSQERY